MSHLQPMTHSNMKAIKKFWIVSESVSPESLALAIEAIEKESGKREVGAQYYSGDQSENDFIPIFKGRMTAIGFARALSNSKRGIICLDELDASFTAASVMINILSKGSYIVGSSSGLKTILIEARVIVVISKSPPESFGASDKDFIMLSLPQGSPSKQPESKTHMHARRVREILYPDRRPWEKLSSEDRDEWVTLFHTYDAVCCDSDPFASSLMLIREELDHALEKFPTWPTDPIHAANVITEEAGELAQKVNELCYEPGKTTIQNAQKEAAQLGAVAIRFLSSIHRYDWKPSEQHHQSGKECCVSSIPLDSDIKNVTEENSAAVDELLSRFQRMKLEREEALKLIETSLHAANVAEMQYIRTQIKSVNFNKHVETPLREPRGCAACDRGDFQLGHADECPVRAKEIELDQQKRLAGLQMGNINFHRGSFSVSPVGVWSGSRFVTWTPIVKTKGQLFYESGQYSLKWEHLDEWQRQDCEARADRYETLRETQA